MFLLHPIMIMLVKEDTVIYYGADDDGSGTTGMLELAEAFAKAKQAVMVQDAVLYS